MTKIVSVNERGSLTLPRDVRDRLGISRGGQVILDVSEDGDISLKAGAVFPIEIYTEERLREFDAMNNKALEGRKFVALKPKAKAKAK